MLTDFDGTFGLSIADPLDFVNRSYTTYPTTYPGAVMINKLLQNPTIKTTFETYLKDITTILFNNATLGNRVSAVQERLKPEVAWDRNITQRSPGVNYHWTYQQFLDNVWQPVNNEGGGGGAGQWGLMQWVVARSQAVAREFGLNLASVPVDGSKPNVNIASSFSAQATSMSAPTGSQGGQVVNAATSAGISFTSNAAFVISSTVTTTLIAALLMKF
jgi:CotH kinase protein